MSDLKTVEVNDSVGNVAQGTPKVVLVFYQGLNENDKSEVINRFLNPPLTLTMFVNDPPSQYSMAIHG